jgi:predicted lipoprotein with Yx(FWY)xxD motif
MKRRILIPSGAVVIAIVIAVLLAATGGNSRNAAAHVVPGAAVGVRQTALGQTLVDAGGRTLYLFQGDKPNRSTLSRAGLAVWPAFTSTGTPLAMGAAHAARIGTITGPGGARQVTYNGHPLYYFVGDRKPGSVSGQRLTDFGATWYVLSPSGSAITRAASSPAPGQTVYGY